MRVKEGWVWGSDPKETERKKWREEEQGEQRLQMKSIPSIIHSLIHFYPQHGTTRHNTYRPPPTALAGCLGVSVQRM